VLLIQICGNNDGIVGCLTRMISTRQLIGLKGQKVLHEMKENFMMKMEQQKENMHMNMVD